MPIDPTTFSLESLSNENIHDAYSFYCRNILFFPLSEENFTRDILKDEGYEASLSLLLRSPENQQICGLTVVVSRKGMICGKNLFIKIFLIDKSIRRIGLGSYLLTKIFLNAKGKIPRGAFIRYGDSIPRYWQPGVDLRHTSLLFFLKKHGFREHNIRQNLSLPFQSPIKEPLKEKNGFKLMRVDSQDFQKTVDFVHKHFPWGVWAQECALSFGNHPPTTFIAKDQDNNIVGFATHSAHYLGSFGPTGVSENIRKRGLGIGSELLRWCIWDLHQNGLKSMDILWVVHDVVKFYCKIGNAYISTVFRPMSRRIF